MTSEDFHSHSHSHSLPFPMEPYPRTPPNPGVPMQWTVPPTQPFPLGGVWYTNLPPGARLVPPLHPVPQYAVPFPMRGQGRGVPRGRGGGGSRGGRSTQGSFSCEACERHFTQKAHYDAHIQQHESCPYAGCAFRATPRVLANHKLLLHSTRKIVLDTPEEIEKWRTERRKNWPSSGNVKRKKEEEEQKRVRGELPRLFKRGRGRRGRGSDDWRDNRRGCRSEEARERDNDSKGEFVDGSALSLLQSCYDSEPEEHKEKEKQEVKTDQPEEKETPKRKRRRLCRYFARGKCLHGDSCPFLHLRNEEEEERKKKRVRRTHPRDNRSLLQKLLAKEIHRERSHVLQCFRFFVQNNFFD